jgi:tetratricopeptide (TPR) repeat protein
MDGTKMIAFSAAAGSAALVGVLIAAGGLASRRALEEEADALRREVELYGRERALLESRVLGLEERLSGKESAAAPLPAAGTSGEEPLDRTSTAAAPFRKEGAPPEKGDTPASDGSRTMEEELDRLLGALLEPSGPSGRKQETWDEIAKLGLMDAAIAHLELRAEENPASAGARLDLGNAYLQKLNTAGELEKARWAIKADGAFDAALAIDPGHWQARFTKAVSLSFWPPITGKREECIRQFETLISQQESAPARPEHAQSYLYLGNLYDIQGKSEKALEVWRRGSSLFPENRDLTSRLEGGDKEK